MVGYDLFKAERKGSYIKVSTWWYSPKSWWFVCFIILIFAALLESHIPDLMHRMGGVKTPWFEANLKVNESIIQRSDYALSDPSQILSLIIKADSVPEIGFYNIRESIERAVAYLNLLKLDYKTEMLLSNKTDENSISIIKIDEIDQRLKDLIDFENALKWIKHKKLNISEFDNVIRCLNNSNLRHCSNQIDSSSWAIKIKEIFENKSYKIMNPNELCDIGVPLIDRSPKVAHYYYLLANLMVHSGNIRGARRIIREALTDDNMKWIYYRQILLATLVRLTYLSHHCLLDKGLLELIGLYEELQECHKTIRKQINEAYTNIPKRLDLIKRDTSIDPQIIADISNSYSTYKIKHHEGIHKTLNLI